MQLGSARSREQIGRVPHRARTTACGYQSRPPIVSVGCGSMTCSKRQPRVEGAGDVAAEGRRAPRAFAAVHADQDRLVRSPPSSATGGRADFGALSYSCSLYWILRGADAEDLGGLRGRAAGRLERLQDRVALELGDASRRGSAARPSRAAPRRDAAAAGRPGAICGPLRRARPRARSRSRARARCPASRSAPRSSSASSVKPLDRLAVLRGVLAQEVRRQQRDVGRRARAAAASRWRRR